MSIQVDDSRQDQVAFRVACPVCGGLYTTHSRVNVFTRDREDAVTGQRVIVETPRLVSDQTPRKVVVDEEMKENPSGRRNGVSLDFVCEVGHAFKLSVAQHKGETLVQFDPPPAKS